MTQGQLMYLEITTKCNMFCDHCCGAYTEEGEDMSLETFKAAIAFEPETVSIGGGEPTLHPQFWEMLGLAIGTCDHVWLATNGSQTDTAMALLGLAMKGVVGVDLSQDEYHDPIDHRVVTAFNNAVNKSRVQRYSDTYPSSMAAIRDVTGKEINAGRCNFGQSDGCACAGLIVRTNGDVVACSCPGSPCFGNVNTEVDIPYTWQAGECYREQPEEETA